MNRTYIDTKTREAEKLQVVKEGSLTWIGAIVLDLILCVSAFFVVRIIIECAGLWHYEVGLNRDLWAYFGTGLDYADRAAKRFGFWKAVWNLFLAVGFELVMFSFLSRCLCVKDGDTDSPSGFVLATGVALRVVGYALVFIFSHSSCLYDTTNKWRFKEAYKGMAAYNRTWFLFWLLVCIVLALIMHAFISGRNDLIVITCLLIIVGLIAVGAYFNDNSKTLSDALWDLAIFVERTGRIIFRH